MADRPRKGSGGDPDYDWVYGAGDRNEQDAPEPTRILPQIPPPSGHRPTPAQPAPMQPPPPRRRRRSRVGSGFKLVVALLVLWLIYVVAVPFFAWSQVEKVAFEPDGQRPVDQPGTTYLMVGSDSRADLSPEERRELTAGDHGGALADTIMLLHIGAGPDVMVSIPRDWTVEGRKINGYYRPGDPTALVAAIESETGVRIDEYVEIGLGGVVGVVDAVGGVEICPETDMRDPKAGLDVTEGCQIADGVTTLAYARTRASARGDLDRVGRQREVVAAIGAAVLSPWTVVNPVRWWQLNNSLPGFFVFGDGTHQLDVARWARAMTTIGQGLTCTMPVSDGSATRMHPDRGPALFETIITDSTDQITDELCTPTGLPE
jgi:LCP family protein required for cell wall assembly